MSRPSCFAAGAACVAPLAGSAGAEAASKCVTGSHNPDVDGARPARRRAERAGRVRS